MNYIFIPIIGLFLALIVSAITKETSNSSSNEYNNDPIKKEEEKNKAEQFFEEIQTKKEDEEMLPDEKYQEALNTINHRPDVLVGLGVQTPIEPSTAEPIELDPNEIPWELKDD